MQKFCSYYQASIKKPDILFLIAILKSFEHLCFDRALDPATNLFEFFVPSSYEPLFLDVMHYFEKAHIVFDLKKMPNRLIHEDEI